MALLAAFRFGLSCLFSYVAIRGGAGCLEMGVRADRAFLPGLLAISAAVAMFAIVESG